MWLHTDTSEVMYEVTTDELDEWADIAFADPYDPPAEKPRPTTRVIFAKMTDAIESVAHKLNSAEYKELYDAAHAMFEHCSRRDCTSAESWSALHLSTFPELEGFVDRVRDIRSRAGQIPPSPAMVFRQVLDTAQVDAPQARVWRRAFLLHHERGSS